MDSSSAVESAFALPLTDLTLHCSQVGAGPTVVLLHAGGERRSVWSPVAARLAQSGYRAVSLDQRGHGETGGDAGSTLDVYAHDLRALLRALAVPVTLVGASLGGLASLLALVDPQTARDVVRLVLVDVLPDPEPAGTRLFLRAVESQRALRDRASFHWPLIEDILGRADELRSVAASLRMPLSVVRGSMSHLSTEAVAAFLRLVPGATLHVVEGAGHLVAHDRPDELADVLLQLLH